MKRGYCGIGIWNWVHECNLGTLFRSAFAFEADFVFTIGRPYKKQSSDTLDTCKHLPYFAFYDSAQFLSIFPKKARLVCVEITPDARQLATFCHPEQAVYLLGSEGQTLPKKLLDAGITVSIPTRSCLNVSTAGSIVLYDRAAKMI